MTDEWAIPDNLLTDHDLHEIDWVSRFEPGSESERAFLARLLEEPDAARVMYRLHIEPRHFENLAYATIYETMLALRDAGTFVDVISVAEALPYKDGRSEEVELWKLYGSYVYKGEVEFYADHMLKRYRRRSVGQLGASLEEVSRTASEAELEPMVQEQVDLVLTDRAYDNELVDADRMLAGRIFGQRAHETTLPTPWRSLDGFIKGFRPGALYVLAGDTGLGKSALALQCAQAMAVHGTALYVSMEMEKAEHLDRLTAQNCAVALDMVERQHYPEGPILDRVTRYAKQARISIRFEDRSNLTVDEIRRVALAIDGLAGITVDYLQLMDLAQRKGENLTDAIGRTTKALKNLARDLKVPVLLLSQLNREAARSGRPTRHHLLASGAIANDADVILLLWREDMDNDRVTTMIVDKNRQGPLGVLDLAWQGSFVRAVEMA